MYVPPHFAMEDHASRVAFMRGHGFATLITAGPDGIAATHLPLLVDADAEGSVRALGSETRGTLRLSVPVSFGLRYLADAVADFMAEHRALEVDLRFSDRFVDVVEEGFDLVVRVGRLSAD